MGKTYAFGLIGCGRIGNRHAEQIARFGRLVAVCDTNENKANALAEKYGATAYYDFNSLLTNPNLDVIAICTPNGLHATHTIAALKTNHHVLCEKPLAITTADCHLMISTAQAYGKQLFVVKQNRFNPPVQAVKQLLSQGKLGAIYSVQLNCFWNRNNDYFHDSWHGTKNLDGGILFTQFSHFIDLLYWFFGDVATVQAFGKNMAHTNSIAFNDTITAIAQFTAGTLATLHFTINAHQQNMEGSLTIFGEKGTVKIGGQYLNELEYQNIAGLDKLIIPQGSPANQYGTYTGSMSNHHLVYQNLIGVLNGTEQPITNIEDGLKTVEIIERIHAAL